MEIELGFRPNQSLALADFSALWRYRDLIQHIVTQPACLPYTCEIP